VYKGKNTDDATKLHSGLRELRSHRTRMQWELRGISLELFSSLVHLDFPFRKTSFGHLEGITIIIVRGS
jgi:hypothetical protein